MDEYIGTVFDEFADYKRNMHDVGVEYQALFKGYVVTHYKYSLVAKNDFSDKNRNLGDRREEVSVLIDFPAELTIAGGSEAEFLEELLPITLITRFVDDFKVGDVIEVFKKDKFGNVSTDTWELMSEVQGKSQSEYDQSFVIAPFRQDLDDGEDDATGEDNEKIIDIPEEDLVNNPANDEETVTSDDDSILSDRNRDTTKPYSGTFSDDFD